MKWCVNLDAIIMNIENITGFEEDTLAPFEGPTMFMNGELSVKNDESVYRKLFPNAYIKTVEGAGHYVHTDKPKTSALLISQFLASLE